MEPVGIQPSTTMVGRDAELTEIASSLGVRPSRPADELTDVLLAGDAGVGKTRLLRALRDLAVSDGWQVYAGHCLDFGDSALPYLPFSEVLGRLGTEQPEVVAAVAAVHPALARLQPNRRQMADTDAVDAESSALDRADLFRSMLAVLEAAAERAPLLLVIEDTHWADQSTRDMLSFLLSRAEACGFAVVASYRSDDLHRRHPLRRQVAEWSRLSGVDRITLTPLDDDAVRSLVKQLVPGGLPESEMADVIARAEGNAFFVEELVSAAAEPGSFVPADLADVLLVRLDRLDDDARQVVRAASASGRRVSHDMLEATADLTRDALEAGIRGAVEMNVLVAERGAYAFRHALLGEAVYDDLLPGERARLHARYVAALREGTARGTAAELARHARLAMDRVTALQASVRAGNEASAVGGPDEAAYHYQQALEILSGAAGAGAQGLGDHGIDLSKLVVNAADALTVSGDPERAVAVIQEQLDRLPDDASDTWRARMLSAQAAAVYITESDVDAVGISQRAVDLAPDGDSGLRARVLATHARILAAYGRLDEAETVGLDGLELAERLNLVELASDVTTTLSHLKKIGPKEGLRAALEEAVARAEAADAVHAELRARFFLGRSFEDYGEYEDAERWFASGVERATAAGLPWAPYGFEARWQLAWIHLVRGEWDRALDLFVVEGPFPPPIPRAMLTAMRLEVLQGRGDDVGNRVAGLRPFWRREGSIAIHAAAVEMVAHGRHDDPLGAVASYDDAVSPAQLDLARRVPRPPPPRGRRHRRRRRRARQSQHRRARAARRPRRAAARRGSSRSASAARTPATGVPRAGRGSSASRPRRCGRAGRPASTPRRSTRWSSPGARPSSCSPTSATSTSWRRCAPSSPASCAPPATSPAPASWATSPAPPPTSCAPNPSSTSCAASAPPPPPAPRPPPTPSPPASTRSSATSPRAAPTARSPSCSSSAPRP